MSYNVRRYGKWALVTGASSGIGEAFARRLASRGINLILVARRKERLDTLAEELEKMHGIQAVPASLDLTKVDFLSDLDAVIGNRKIGILVNNAGFGLKGSFVENDKDFKSKMVLLNCWAYTMLQHHFLSEMKERGRGAIFNISSVLAAAPIPSYATYAATKTYDLFLSEALHHELKGEGIDVLTVCPGTTDTEFHDIANSGFNPRMKMRTAENVVDTAMEAIGRKPVVVDGTMHKVAFFVLRYMPRNLIYKLIFGIKRRIKK